jgi:hypothetical protein
LDPALWTASRHGSVKKKPTRLPKIIQKDQFLVSSKRKSGIITVVNWTFPKITSSKKNTIQSKILWKQDNPNTADVTNMHFIISKKKFSKDKIFQ